MTNQYPGSTSEVQCTVAGHAAKVVLNRPERKNAVTGAMWATIAELFESFGKDDDIRVVLLSGTGADFSAGADISEFDAMRRDSTSARTYEAANSRAFAAIRDCAVPVVAAIRGVCFGGGFGIAAACDLRFAMADAVFCVPPARLGLAYPVDAMADVVDAAGTQVARQMIYTGDRVSAEEALSAGIIVDIFDINEFDEKIQAIVERIASNAPLSVKASKAAIDAVVFGGAERTGRARHLGELTFDSEDYSEGRAAFRERRPPIFKGR